MMARDLQSFRSCVSDAIPKVGRKIWPSLYLDLKFIQLGIKKSILFDYADVSVQNLNGLLHSIKIKCRELELAEELVAIQVGNDKFIIQHKPFLEYLSQVERIYFSYDWQNVEKRVGMILDISSDTQNAEELKDKTELDELENLISEAKRMLVENDKILKLHKNIVSDSENISWCTIYGIFLNYPVVYWLKTHNSNLSGEDLTNYQIRITEKEVFGISVPRNYAILSFTIPVYAFVFCEKVILNWYSELSSIMKDASDFSIYLSKEQKSASQVTF